MSELDRLRWQLDISWSLLSLHVADLSDEEALWEPGSPCWTVRPQPDGTWKADFATTEPDPVPMLTIGWVMWHIGFWWSTAHANTFGPGPAVDLMKAGETTPWPGSVTEATAWLTDCHSRWQESLDGVTDLDSRERTAWFIPDVTLGHVLGWANIELMKNAAEIGSIRHLYACRTS
ncbi:DinB family protein [Nonomuraea sp. NBC_01738]|uniref:DinB family protein n=1 Tax=Nonomuraea sp. NBC_01738 TaxID=2976003 RepID=UPI002E15086F|nr:DinB family protein [Nonomuraea sp. NBC_01738]